MKKATKKPRNTKLPIKQEQTGPDLSGDTWRSVWMGGDGVVVADNFGVLWFIGRDGARRVPIFN